VRLKLNRGEFSWKVIDPAGNVAWQKQVTAAERLEIEEEVPGIAGEWRIVLDYEQFKGSYYIKMEAVGLP
jgi:hypothetical protein